MHTHNIKGQNALRHALLGASVRICPVSCGAVARSVVVECFSSTCSLVTLGFTPPVVGAGARSSRDESRHTSFLSVSGWHRCIHRGLNLLRVEVRRLPATNLLRL
ncbi:hypothetical protein TRVL_08949 [Trypanosoma vivax]|nr:hypothetical protein TRVL_08949 [Trypanosoma vivax]